MFMNIVCTAVFVLTAFAELTSCARGGKSLQCIDDDGKNADWYIVYKFPVLDSQRDKKLFSGERYATISSNSPTNWTLSPNSVYDNKSIFARTLAPLYDKTKLKQISTIFYNDQPPGEESPSSKYAHAKGVLATDKKKGFWLIHSVPGFAPFNKYVYPRTGQKFGQAAMCISLKIKQIELLVQHVAVAKPYIYHMHNPWKTTNSNNWINKLEKKQWNTTHQWIETNLTTLKGVHFRSFYKSRKDELDLYAGIVAPTVKTSLLVETWRRDPVLDSECTNPKLEVENVKQVNVSFGNSQLTGQFGYMLDHSKWAISRKDDGANLVCIGDINRMKSQFRRGGGTTCMSIPSVWKAFYQFVGATEKCDK